MPGFDRVRLAIERFTSRSGSLAHGTCVVSLAGHRGDGRCESHPIAHGYGDAASVAFDEAGYFAVLSTNEQRGPARCSYAVKFARYDKPFKFGPQRDDVDIRS